MPTQMPLWTVGPPATVPQGAYVYGDGTTGNVVWWDGVTMVDAPGSTTTGQSSEQQSTPAAQQP